MIYLTIHPSILPGRRARGHRAVTPARLPSCNPARPSISSDLFSHTFTAALWECKKKKKKTNNQKKQGEGGLHKKRRLKNQQLFLLAGAAYQYLGHILPGFLYTFIIRALLHKMEALFIHPSIHPFIHPSIHSFSHPSIHSSIHPFILPSIHSLIHPSIHSFHK